MALEKFHTPPLEAWVTNCTKPHESGVVSVSGCLGNKMQRKLQLLDKSNQDLTRVNELAAFELQCSSGSYSRAVCHLFCFCCGCCCCRLSHPTRMLSNTYIYIYTHPPTHPPTRPRACRLTLPKGRDLKFDCLIRVASSEWFEKQNGCKH